MEPAEHAGFTSGTPWLKVNPNYKEINVLEAIRDKASIFHYYKKLIELRKNHKVFVYGDYQPTLEENESLYSYVRTYENDTLFFISNFTNQTEIIEVPAADINLSKAEMLITNHNGGVIVKKNKIQLNAYEARIYLVKHKCE